VITVVVPLAGPDFYKDSYGIKPLANYKGEPLIKKVLGSRKWMKDFFECESNELIFVLYENDEHTQECREYLSNNWPASKFVTVSQYSSGATFSVLAGVALSNFPANHLIVDLADIIFETEQGLFELFKDNGIRASIPYFDSFDSKFSYLELDDNIVLRAVEKEVISMNASAGVYFFRTSADYFKAAAWSVENPKYSTVNDVFFVCPSINAFVSDRAVSAFPVSNVDPISLIFH
jgi:hypothetical protein